MLLTSSDTEISVPSVFHIELPDSFQFLESSPVFHFTRYFISLVWVILSGGKLAEMKKEAWILKWYLQITGFSNGSGHCWKATFKRNYLKFKLEQFSEEFY